MLFSFERPDRKDSENQFTPHNFQLSVEDARLAFSSFDLNNDGYIDKEELAQAMEMIGFKMTPDEIEGKCIQRVLEKLRGSQSLRPLDWRICRHLL